MLKLQHIYTQMANTISKSKDSVSYLKVPFQHSNGKV